MDLVLRREPTIKETTFGDLSIDGAWFCFTLEDVIREKIGSPVAEWKQHGHTAIPAGRYRLGVANSPRFGPGTLTLLDVQSFSHIRIHAGNDDGDTEGCILVGYRKTVDPRGDGGDVLDSRAALSDLRARVLPEIRDAWLTIVNP